VVQLTTNQPHRVAERIATLDLLSGGRVDLGMGEAAGPAELHPFNIRVRDKRERWEEAVKAIVPMFTRESWEFHGQYYDFEARNVIPKPFRSRIRRSGSPAPTSRPSARRRMGHGALGFTFVTRRRARLGAQVLQQPPEQFAEAHRLSQQSQCAMVSGFMCAPTDAEAEARPRLDVLHLRALLLRPQRRRCAGHVRSLKEYQSWKGGPEEKKALESG